MDARIKRYGGADALFEAWLAKVDARVEARCGLGLFDLADVPMRDWYFDGMAPAEAANLALENEGW